MINLTFFWGKALFNKLWSLLYRRAELDLRLTNKIFKKVQRAQEKSWRAYFSPPSRGLAIPGLDDGGGGGPPLLQKGQNQAKKDLGGKNKNMAQKFSICQFTC